MDDGAVRLAVYRHFAETGDAPPPADLPGDDVEGSLRRLADDHVLVLREGTAEIWMAHPFSAVPTAFRVEAGGRTYHGNCIWDGLGILALLDSDGTVFTECADCGDPMELHVAGGRLLDDEGVAHFAVPAARWWDDIGFT
jgi:Alkylmercury lyase